MAILLGEFFDWVTKRSPGEDPAVLVAGHIAFDWYLPNYNELVKVDEWMQGWEADDFLDRAVMHELGQPKQGNFPWVVREYKNEEFFAHITYIGIWTIERVYLGIAGYDGIEGFQSWDRNELRNGKVMVYGFATSGTPSQTINADPTDFVYKSPRVLDPAIRVSEAAKIFTK